MVDIDALIAEIGVLRKELEECIENKQSDKAIIEISQKLDLLIVEYIKMILDQP